MPRARWTIVLPGVGEYVVELDTSTLPEGVSLREGTEPTREVSGGHGGSIQPGALPAR